MSPTAAAFVGLAGFALIAAILRTMAIARHADEIADAHWHDLALLQSESGVAFFPTVDARLELEMAITEVVALERRSGRGRLELRDHVRPGERAAMAG